MSGNPFTVDLLPGVVISLTPPYRSVTSFPPVWKSNMLVKHDAHGYPIIWQIGFDRDTQMLTTVSGRADGIKTPHPVPVEALSTRSLDQQAYQDGRIRYLEKLRKGYSSGQAEERLTKHRAMLAKDYILEKRRSSPYYVKGSNHVQPFCFPLGIEPKIDGTRCLAALEGTTVTLFSKGNKAWQNLPQIRAEVPTLLNKLPPGCVLDGELYYPGCNFSEIQSAVTTVKTVHPLNLKLGYYIFDVITTEALTHEQRKDLLEEAFADSTLSYCKLIKMHPVHSEAEIMVIHDYFTKNGYEGAMLRQLWNPAHPKKDKLWPLCLYKHGARSRGLLKVKDFDEEEFVIIGGAEATGVDAGTVVFRVQDTTHKVVFDVRPMGSREIRAEWLRDLHKLIGKQLTVRFQGRSKDLVPRFPVGQGLRKKDT